MKKSKLFIRLVTCCLAIIVPFTNIKAQIGPQEVLSRMEQTARNQKSLYAKLRQEMQDRTIGGREVYTGEIYIKRIAKGRDRGRIEYNNGQLVFFDDGRIVFNGARVIPASPLMRQGKVPASEEMQFFTTQYTRSADEILDRYEVVLMGDGEVDSASTAVLELTPKGKSEISKIQWWINKTNWLPVKVEFNRGNRKKAVFILSDIKNGIVIEGDIFVLPPKLRQLK